MKSPFGSSDHTWCAGKLLKAVQSFCNGSNVYVRVNVGMSERFLVDVGLPQSCIMSPWLYITFFRDDAMRFIRARSCEGNGPGMMRVGGGC